MRACSVSGVAGSVNVMRCGQSPVADLVILVTWLGGAILIAFPAIQLPDVTLTQLRRSS